MSGSDLVVWGVGTGRCMRAHWALAELGLDYETKPIRSRSGETLTPEYTALSPSQKIPLLQDGDFTLSESGAILTYLADTYDMREPPLAPRAGRARARYNEWCSFIGMELDATSLYVLRRHKYLPEIYGEALVACAVAADYFRRLMGRVEAALGDGRATLMGADFTGADIILTTCLDWALGYEIGLADTVLAYRARMNDREPYAKARAICYPDG